MPPDLDRQGKRKFRKLCAACEPDADMELLANYARQYSSLISIRAERAKQEAAGIFTTLLPGRDGSLQLNPLLTGENRLIASLGRMLKELGLATRDQGNATGSKPPSTPPPPGFSGPEPACGWAIELALCRGKLGDERELSPDEVEADRRRKVNEKLLAAGDWRAYETEHDEGPGGNKRG